MIDQLRDPKGHYPDNFGIPLLLCMCQDAADEIERLKSENQKLALDYVSISGQAFDALADSSASQAREQQLRYALDHYQHGGSSYAKIAKEALSIPQDATALQALIAKAGEVMRERAAQEGWMSADGNCEDRVRRAILSIANITLDDVTP